MVLLPEEPQVIPAIVAAAAARLAGQVQAYRGLVAACRARRDEAGMPEIPTYAALVP